MDITNVHLELTDGREIEFSGLFALPADRIALERHFGVNSQTVGTPEGREEWLMFLIFRLCVREVEEFHETSFDDFVEQLARYRFVKDGKALSLAPPTEPEANTG